MDAEWARAPPLKAEPPLYSYKERGLPMLWSELILAVAAVVAVVEKVISKPKQPRK